MNNEYKGINIYKKVVIVVNDSGQGYVIEEGNKKSLESAIHWSKQSNDDYIPKQFTYDNGSFQLSLKNSAGCSSQGGKLSFWNCDITCPDGQTFLIGISTDVLIEFLLKNTLVDGVCKDKHLYLGRSNSNVLGIYSTNMDSYKQAIKDEETRHNLEHSDNKYVIGEIVSTLTKKQIYLGEYYENFAVYKHWYETCNSITILPKPVKIYLFADIYHEEEEQEAWCGLPGDATRPNGYCTTKKPNRMHNNIIADKTYLATIINNTFYRQYTKPPVFNIEVKNDDKIKKSNYSYSDWERKLILNKQYTSSPIIYTEQDIKALINELLTDKYNYTIDYIKANNSQGNPKDYINTSYVLADYDHYKLYNEQN
jgi:hypothetical protein